MTLKEPPSNDAARLRFESRTQIQLRVERPLDQVFARSRFSQRPHEQVSKVLSTKVSRNEILLIVERELIALLETDVADSFA